MRPALLALLVGCVDPVFHATAEVNDRVGTVLDVTWEPLGGGEAWVEFGPDTGFGRTTPPVPDGDGESHAHLVGNKPFERVHWRVVGRRGDELVVGPAQVTPVDGIPAALPDIALLDDDGSFDGWVLGVAWAAETFLFILDRDADVVWYERLSLGRATLSVEPVPGEAAVRYLDVSLDHDLDESRVVTLGLDGEELERVDVEQGHHSFEVLPDGTLAWLAIDVRDDPTWGPLVGDRVLARGADGSVRTLWSTWDDFVYDPEVTFETDFYPQGTDWTHGNTLAWDAAQDSFWVTLGGIDQLVEVDAQSGALLTRVGAGGCEITPALDGYGAGYGPHGANSTPEGTLLVFDNHHVAGASASRVVELKLDEDAARVDWVFEGESGWSTLVLGGAKRQADGGTFVAWGDTGYMQLLDAAGRQVWLANVNAIVSDAVLLADPYGR